MWHVLRAGEVNTGLRWGDEGKKLFRRSSRRWKDNIKNGTSRSGMGRHGLDWCG